MAHYDDYQGLWATVQSLRVHHPEVMSDCELLVVDNNPESPHGKDASDLINGWVGNGRYLAAPDVVGTSAPRDLVFREASGDAVLCIDCHVLIEPGAISRLLAYYDSHPETMDLLSGPLVYDDLHNISTHFADEWRDHMWGTWDTDKRGVDPTAEPFEIPAMGLGLFSCRRESWLGFNPAFRGFGGEEFYIHEKFRQSGATCLCLPFLRWVHRFGRPGGQSYSLRLHDRVKNYIIGHQELGLSLHRLRKHFVSDHGLPVDQWRRLVNEAREAAVSVEPPASEGVTLDDLYKHAAAANGDISGHCEKLKTLAAQCDHVIDLGHRPESTTALLAGQPGTLVSYAGDAAHADVLATCRGQTDLQCHAAEEASGTKDVTDFLLVDGLDTYESLWSVFRQRARHVRRWIAIHNTEVYSNELLRAVRSFVCMWRDWSVLYHSRDNNGLTVLGRLPDDRHVRPTEFARHCRLVAKRHDPTIEGNAPAATLEHRLLWCTECQYRDGCRCVMARDKVARMAPVEESECPLGKWHGAFHG
jgi:hypothetical protein